MIASSADSISAESQYGASSGTLHVSELILFETSLRTLRRNACWTYSYETFSHAF